MPYDKQDVEKAVDEVWAGALDKIMKGGAPATSRQSLGDDIDLLVPQSAIAPMMNNNPGFASVLYSSAYASAKRNAYIVIRRLGMPADFFWKFDYWSQERAFDTLKKVVARVFNALMVKQKEGVLDLALVDVEKGRFELTFADSAECAMLKADDPICFFHAGLFAGILGALLDRELDSYEVKCAAQGADTCRFKLGRREDRDIIIGREAWFQQLSLDLDIVRRAEDSLEKRQTRQLGNTVDISYYKMLLSSVFLPNLTLLEDTWLETAEAYGKGLASLLQKRFSGDVPSIFDAFYSQLKHLEVTMLARGDHYEAAIREAPEVAGPLARLTLIAVLQGEMKGLLSGLTGKRYSCESSQQGDAMLLRFAPQV
ncbi:MAG: hypothetical protein FJ039_11430 [Chloroflexi bacterium]|nr:hypothetical protein [Chloroflexota bacterium]